MTENRCELSDRELDQAAGGFPNDRKIRFYNSTNELIGYRESNSNTIHFVPCDKCGKPMHSGWFGWYCDPCHRHLVFVSHYPWNGTSAELIAAAG